MAAITKKVFNDLAIWMMGFGLFVGTVFPVFMSLLGVSQDITNAFWFRLACILAGLLVGSMNIMLAKTVVEKRVRNLANHMKEIENHLYEISGKNEPIDCDGIKCHIQVDSLDALGESAIAFNRLVDTISNSMKIEMSLRTYTQMLSRHLDTDSLCKNALEMLISDYDAQSGAIFVIKGGDLQLIESKGISEVD